MTRVTRISQQAAVLQGGAKYRCTAGRGALKNNKRFQTTKKNLRKMENNTMVSLIVFNVSICNHKETRTSTQRLKD